MRFDLSPLYRSTVGFDCIATVLDQVASFDKRPTYPPYNIERLTENEYRITYHGGRWVRQARRQDRGEGNTLSIRGEKKNKRARNKERAFLHRGIASRAFSSS